MVPPASRTWQLLQAATESLVQLRGDLALTRVSELEVKLQGYESSTATTETARKREADTLAFSTTADRIKLEAEIAGKEDFRSLLILCIEQGVELPI